MRGTALLGVLWLLSGGLAAARTPIYVEGEIRRLEAVVRSGGRRSYETRYRNGHIHVKYKVRGRDAIYVELDPHGVKLREWSRKAHGIVRYEAWYTTDRCKERLLEDDRMVSFDSYHRNGQKWEEYHFNKQKRLKSFYQYDKNGKLQR